MLQFKNLFLLFQADSRKLFIEPSRQHQTQVFGRGNEDDWEFSFVFQDMIRNEFQAQMIGC